MDLAAPATYPQLEIDTKFQLSVSIVYLVFKVAFRTVVTKPVSGAMIGAEGWRADDWSSK